MLDFAGRRTQNRLGIGFHSAFNLTMEIEKCISQEMYDTHRIFSIETRTAFSLRSSRLVSTFSMFAHFFMMSKSKRWLAAATCSLVVVAVVRRTLLMMMMMMWIAICKTRRAVERAQRERKCVCENRNVVFRNGISLFVHSHLVRTEDSVRNKQRIKHQISLSFGVAATKFKRIKHVVSCRSCHPNNIIA